MRILLLAAFLIAALPAIAQPNTITAEQCQQINQALGTWGYAIVRIGALARGFTEEQLRWAIAKCGARPPR